MLSENDYDKTPTSSYLFSSWLNEISNFCFSSSTEELPRYKRLSNMQGGLEFPNLVDQPHLKALIKKRL